jgi:lysozyme
MSFRPASICIVFALVGCADRIDKPTAGIWFDTFERAPGPPARKAGKEGIDLTKSFEGWRARLYNDAAWHCTIGYGHLVHFGRCDGQPAETPFAGGIDMPAGERLLVTDMQRAEQGVSALVTVSLTDGQYDALCDFVYNVGARNFGASTLLVKVNRQENDAIAQQFLRWTLAGGKEQPGLKRRREAEVAMFFGGAVLPRTPQLPVEPPIDIHVGEDRR